jgi:ADP-heptose:LPS heptosyltransferase
VNISHLNKILITRTDKLGDVILTLPLIAEVSRIFPDVKIHFLVRKYVKDLIENYPPVDNLIFSDDFKNNSDFIQYLKKEKFDAVINVFPRLELAISFYRAGIRTRIGTGFRWFSFLYNKKMYQHRKYAEKHESEYNIDLLKTITERATYNRNFFFSYTNYEKTKLFEKLKSEKINITDNYIIIHPGSKGSAKDWSVENFKDYINLFLDEFGDFFVILTGTEEEKKIISEIISSVRQKNSVINLAEKLNLRELMIVIDNSKLFISNSTGPIHIAGALNKNIIGFYPNSAPMNAKRWRPLSENSVILSPVDLSDNMNDIKPENVISETKKFM